MDKKDRKTFWLDRPVFITGCTGFLGSWLTKELIHLGARVVGLVRDTVPQSLLYQGDEAQSLVVVRGVVEDFVLMERVLNEFEIDTVIHLAAQTLVTVANRNPMSTFDANIRGTWNILEASRRVSCVKRIAVASSDKAYGSQPQLPYTEEAPLTGAHPYDVSKSCADLVCQAFVHTYSLPVCIVRCGNFYGGGDLNFNRIVPGTLLSIHRDSNPVIRSDGSYLRDYFYIEDAVDAYLHLVECMDDDKVRGQAFNFSPEAPLSVIELVKKILEITGDNHLKPVILGEATNEIKEQFLSAAKAHRTLGWHARHNLSEGLAKTARWYADFFEREEEKTGLGKDV
jgi:CDP-glucose 4,6-dehydratase